MTVSSQLQQRVYHPVPVPFSPASHEDAHERPTIRFRAPNGSEMQVFELVRPCGSSLVFSSDEGFRRVRRYPPDWRTLDAAALWELSWTR